MRVAELCLPPSLLQGGRQTCPCLFLCFQQFLKRLLTGSNMERQKMRSKSRAHGSRPSCSPQWMGVPPALQLQFVPGHASPCVLSLSKTNSLLAVLIRICWLALTAWRRRQNEVIFLIMLKVLCNILILGYDNLGVSSPCN